MPLFRTKPHLISSRRLVPSLLLVALLIVAPVLADGFDEADRLRFAGRYAEAEELYAAAADKQPVRAAIGKADCLSARGDLVGARKLLQDLKPPKPSAILYARRATLALNSGQLEEATNQVRKALKLAPENVEARWCEAELQRRFGRIVEAAKNYRWFAEYFRRHAAGLSDDDLPWVGLGVAQHARWSRRSQLFDDLVNRIYALEGRKDRALVATRRAELFLEKFNHRDGTVAVQTALAANGNYTAAHIVRARLALRMFDFKRAERSLRRALQLNQHSLAAQLGMVDLQLMQRRLPEAQQRLEEARKLDPHDERTLGRLLAVLLVRASAGQVTSVAADSTASKLIAEVEARNRHCGQFYLAAGEAFDRLRKFPASLHYLALARERLPDLITVPGRLGTMHMRLGDEQSAAPLLKESFRIDPYNVRVKNMLSVLEVLDGYNVLESEHFVIRFDRGQDELFAKYALDFLETEAYPEVVEALGFKPGGKTLFEFFSRARNTSGHGWFSARVVGLPNIGTVGACTGKMVAMASPGGMPRPYNWARVLKHEFVHVVNLQQTNFNIPHWYTEGLAVWLEATERPPQFDEILVKRAAANTLLDLKTIDHAFVRPQIAGDRTLAYCQGELYVEYMAQRFGDDAHHKLLGRFANTMSVADAIKGAFNVSMQDFENGYRQFVKGVVSELGRSDVSSPPQFLAAAAKVRRNPKSAEANARLAFAYLQRNSHADALKYARAAEKLAGDDREPLAEYVIARLEIATGRREAAKRRIEASLSKKKPHRNLLELMAALELSEKRYDSAAAWYALGERQFADKTLWLQRQARVYLRMKNDEKLKQLLPRIASRVADDILIRQKLAAMAAEEERWDEAVRWAKSMLHVNVRSVAAHGMLAQAHWKQKKYRQAMYEAHYANRLDRDNADWPLLRAKCHVQLKENLAARQVLKRLLERHPNHEEARKLMETIKP